MCALGFPASIRFFYLQGNIKLYCIVDVFLIKFVNLTLLLLKFLTVSEKVIFQASVVQMLDSAIRRINHYPAGKYEGNQLHSIYPMDSVIHLLNNWGWSTMRKKLRGLCLFGSLIGTRLYLKVLMS